VSRSSSRHRSQRLAALIQETLAAALVTELKDPRVGFATITGVDVSPDGTHATVRVSVLGSDEDRTQAHEGLASARGFLRSHLAHSLPLRVAPELHFVMDRGLERARRIDALLDQLHDGEGNDS